MTRRALLVGSQTYGLTGCEADVALMRDSLGERGFDAIDVRIGGDATRAGILDGFERLIGSIAPGDAVVVYYSGHGGRLARPDADERRAAGLSTMFQFIVPHDLDDSAKGDFRGILSEELTALQARLCTAFTALGEEPNVTTILDCCHSGYMARAVELRPKSIGEVAKAFSIKGIRERAAEVGADLRAGAAATNPHVVRLVACQAEQSAFELPTTRGDDHGALTDALATVLHELGGAPVSWAAIADLVRRRVRALVPEQRPDVEGPADRLAFSTESLPDRDAFTMSVDRDRVTIEAAAILGIAVGDEFDLCSPGTAEPAGRATVRAVEGGDAVLDVTIDGDSSPVGLIAVPRRVSVPKLVVAVDLDDPPRSTVVSALDRARQLDACDERRSPHAMATLVADGAELRLLDSAGAPWRDEGFAIDDSGLERLCDVLDGVAVGRRLLDLPSGSGASSLDPVVEITFGAVSSGDRRALPLHGERLPAGTAVTLAVRNTSPDEVFVWVFDVGVSGRSSLITNAGRSGTRLGPAGDSSDTLDVWGRDGEALFWPTDVPTGGGGDEHARPETFVVLTADRHNDLGALASPRSSAPRARGAESALDALLDEVRVGVREAPAAVSGEPPLRYRIDLVEFFLVPV